MTGKTHQDFFITPELTHRRELILHLLEYSNKLVVVKGEHDSGKSTFFNELSHQSESNLIIRPLTVSAVTNINDIYRSIIEGDRQDELQESEYNLDKLNQWLTRCQNKQQTPALLIDNVDLLNDDLIKQLFILFKNANKTSVLHICIFCEASFLERLEESGVNQDDSDILHIIEMPNLSEKQTEQYIRNNYPIENGTELNLFDEKTIKQIHRISHGLPGRINALCEQYLDDPAKKPETINDKQKTSFSIKSIILKNKLVLTVVALLMLLSIGVATLLQQTEKAEVKQTIKLQLPKLSEVEKQQDETVKMEVSEELEPEPVTIEELSPPVIPELVKDLQDKAGVSVYNDQGRLVAHEDNLQTIAEKIVEKELEKEPVIEEVLPHGEIPIVKTDTVVEVISESEAPEPEPKVEPVKAPEPKPVAKSEPAVKNIDWLIKQDPEKYVLQLIGAYGQETIDEYLSAFKDTDHKIISFTASNKGKEWHVLVYGLFENRDQAVAAIETLPTRAKLMAPWPRTVQSIKDLLK